VYDNGRKRTDGSAEHRVFDGTPMTLYEYLQMIPEHIPDWLKQFRVGDVFDSQQFFASRVVYYPGSGTDGHPVKLFGSTHCAHCFVYADYGITENNMKEELNHPIYRFRGYHTLARVQLREHDLVPDGWNKHVNLDESHMDMSLFVKTSPFGFLEVLERDQEFDNNHGAQRLAILFLGADGVAAYDALFCQQSNILPPFAIVIQDHGFGSNYTNFGQDGLLHQIASECNVFPRWLLVADNTYPWEGFVKVPDVDGNAGGMHNTLRFLYERCKK
jgi:hypothetical protein